MEEYVIIVLNIIWFNPPSPPVRADRVIISIINWGLFKEVTKINGAIFCQVKIMVHWTQVAIFITWGNQKWNGAIPIFTQRAIKIISFWMLIILVSVLALVISLVKIIIKEAIAWAKKYLIAVSVERGVNLTTNKGISLIKLISKPSQQVNHELAEQAIVVPITKVNKKDTWYIFIKIKKKEIYTLIDGVWTR